MRKLGFVAALIVARRARGASPVRLTELKFVA